MGLLYFMLKLYPFIGLSFGFASFDIAVGLRRKGNRIWLFMAFMGLVFVLLTVPWVYFRGDKNADRWFSAVAHFLRV